MKQIFKHDPHTSAALRRHKESSRKIKMWRKEIELAALRKSYDDSHRKT